MGTPQEPHPLFEDMVRARHVLEQSGLPVVDRILALWRSTHRYVDNQFVPSWRQAFKDLAAASEPGPNRTKAYAQLHRRWWEMFVAELLIQQQIDLVPRNRWNPEWGNAGPDFLAVAGHHKIWIECVAPDHGTGPDNVPTLPMGTSAGTVPTDAIQLRLLAAIDTKRKQYVNHVNQGIIAPQDGYVIALNAHAVSELILADHWPPFIVRSLYGLGHEAVQFNFSTGKVVSRNLTRMPVIKKKVGTQIEADLFVTGRAKEVSAVLYSTIDAWYHQGTANPPGLLVHNLTASAPLPNRWLPLLPSYSVTVEGGVGTIVHDEPAVR